MARNSGLDGLMKWAAREEWAGAFDDVIDEHIVEVCEEWGVEPEFEELAEILGEDVVTTLWGCAFEDLLTRPGEDGERTIVDDYLKRRGWKESAGNRRYMEALRDSVMSLYEVSDIVPGKSFLARDLIRGGEPVRVSERSATRAFKPWDRIAARIVEVSGRHVMSGGLLPFGHDLAAELLDELRADMEAARGATQEMLAEAERETQAKGEAGEPVDVEDLLASMVLVTAASLVTGLWLDDALERVLGEEGSELINSDGDAVEFHTLRFPLKDGASVDELRERLRGVPGFREENGDFWNWVNTEEPARDAGSPPRASVAPRGRIYRVTMDDGAEVLGNVAIVGGALEVSANSESRAGVARALVHDAAGDLLGTPELTIGTPPAGMGEADLPIPQEEKAAIVERFLREHYEEMLDQPIPILDGMTPREAAARQDSRAKAAAWLKLLENGSAGAPGAEFDFTWMWRELGIEDLRA